MSVVISYARLGAGFAIDLHRKLAARGVPVWLDRVNLVPGSNWQKSIENAIRSCQQLLLLLSPEATSSPEVEAEWSLARELGIPIIVVRLRSAEVPFRLRTLQWIDGDESGADALVELLARNLPRHDVPRHRLVHWSEAHDVDREKPNTFIQISLHDGEEGPPYTQWDALCAWNDRKRTVLAHAAAYSNVKSLLDDLYLNYLAGAVPAYSYGSQWLLLRGGGWLAVPFAWLVKPGTPCHEVDLSWISRTPAPAIGLTGGSHWLLSYGTDCLRLLRGGFHGVAVRTERMMNIVDSHPKSAAYMLSNSEFFECSDSDGIVEDKYNFHHVYCSAFPELQGRVFREKVRISERKLRAAWKVASHLA